VVESARIAYFTMEIGIEPGMPTYSGGLGMLAGDSVRSAADLGLPMVAVSLLHRKGYFKQKLDGEGRQTELPCTWNVKDYLAELEPKVQVNIAGRPISIRAWSRDLVGEKGQVVRLLLLDTNLPDNAPEDRTLTDYLYGGDQRYRLSQEIVLGVGGVRMLRALGYDQLRRFHMNEGHAALLTAELLREEMEGSGKRLIDSDVIDAVREQCVFTTHTPVPAGHDKFAPELVRELVGTREAFERSGLFEHEGMLNLTYAALNLSRYVNGVAKRHGEVSREMFGKYPIDSITNGVHLAHWTAPAFHDLFDEVVPGWPADNASIRFAMHIPLDDLASAHDRSKHEMIEYVNQHCGTSFDDSAMTIGCARRATAYKRLDLILHDLSRLGAMADRHGPIQIVFAGKAHPRDDAGKNLIRNVFKAMREAPKNVRIAYVENYDMELGRLITAGADLWLNTPQPPMEASGTSGMKAAINGVPSFSILDGWWIEGCIEGVTGWAIGTSDDDEHDVESDAGSLYQKLDEVILPMYYTDRRTYLNVMRNAIALNGSFFNTERMMSQYVVQAYFG